MASTRYKTLLAVLNDPLNRAVVEREILRRSEKMTPPPISRVGGGVVYLTMEEYRHKYRDYIMEGEDPDSYAEVFGTPGEWYVATEEAEVGPFSTMEEATASAESLLAGQGITVLRDHPWTKSDEDDYPL